MCRPSVAADNVLSPLSVFLSMPQHSTESNLSEFHKVSTDIERDPRLFAVVLFGSTPSPRPGLEPNTADGA